MQTSAVGHATYMLHCKYQPGSQKSLLHELHVSENAVENTVCKLTCMHGEWPGSEKYSTFSSLFGSWRLWWMTAPQLLQLPLNDTATNIPSVVYNNGNDGLFL